MSRELPQIAKDAQRLQAAIRQAVLRFNRLHKYDVGAELCRDARQVVRLSIRAWRDREARAALAAELCVAVDDLKITMQLAKAIDAWPSFKEFEALARLVKNVGQQSGGWRKQLNSMSQNASDEQRRRQRAPILSSRATSQGVAP